MFNFIQLSYIVLIETYWNVNYLTAMPGAATACVLIETYWNVNQLNPVTVDKQYIVLIETYWNVNAFSILSLKPLASS